MLSFCCAQPCEIDRCYEILDAGRKLQRSQGFTQWTDDYPNMQAVCDDVANKAAYVLKVGHKIAGYVCVCFGDEPAYNAIDGKWNCNNEPYAVIHRMVFSPEFRGRGLSSTMWQFIGELCLQKGVGYIRVDTGVKNAAMLHILEKNGFKRCGLVFYGATCCVAFDKKL